MTTYLESSFDYLNWDYMRDNDPRSSSHSSDPYVYIDTFVLPICSSGLISNRELSKIFGRIRAFRRELEEYIATRNSKSKEQVLFKRGEVLSRSVWLPYSLWRSIYLYAIPIQSRYNDTGQYEWIQAGLAQLEKTYGQARNKINMVIPMEAFGEGLDNDVLKQIVEDVFAKSEKFNVYAVNRRT